MWSFITGSTVRVSRHPTHPPPLPKKEGGKNETEKMTKCILKLLIPTALTGQNNRLVALPKHADLSMNDSKVKSGWD